MIHIFSKRYYGRRTCYPGDYQAPPVPRQHDLLIRKRENEF